MRLSVIIPLGPHESEVEPLAQNLILLPPDVEILFVRSASLRRSPECEIQLENSAALFKKSGHTLRWLSAKDGRASCLNEGARNAKGEILWFLHADSFFNARAAAALYEHIQKYPKALLYFKLAFRKKWMPFMMLNEWGAGLRSRVFRLPFGDQGFCLRKDVFKKIGGYPEGLAYGEDHLFVWAAHHLGIPVQPIDEKLFTSLRKYQQYGWLKTTFTHQKQWIKQAWPEWKKYRKQKRRGLTTV